MSTFTGSLAPTEIGTIPRGPTLPDLCALTGPNPTTFRPIEITRTRMSKWGSVKHGIPCDLNRSTQRPRRSLRW